MYNDVLPDASEDDKDVLVQRDSVAGALKTLGYTVDYLPVTLNLQNVMEYLNRSKPGIVFNLVESIEAAGRFIYFAPSLLDHLNIPYTGAAGDSLFLTTNKILTKERLMWAGLPTPVWSSKPDIIPEHKPPYIIKPVWEDASVGLDEQALVYNQNRYTPVFNRQREQFGESFAEAYIEGREFNLSLLDSASGPKPLPPAEIRFEDYPADKPHLVDYRAKWESDSFEYTHTVRHFDFPASDKPLLDRLQQLAVQCWKLFGLRGYARVDFRVDNDGNPWILEVNANPCISPDSGFVAAATQAGIAFDIVIERIVSASLKANT